MTSFLSQYKHPSQTTNVPHSAPAPSGSQASSPAGSRSTAPSSPLSNTPEARDPGQMQKEIDELKRKLNAANELRTQDPFSAVLERLDRMEDRFNKIEERLTSVQTLETNVKQLEDTLSKSTFAESIDAVRNWLENMPEWPDRDPQMILD